MKTVQTIGLVLSLVMVVGAQSYIKPVAAMSDYNGTYRGSPGTGNARFTTLYRDNQDDGSRSGCRGEGCGRHPGVDIAVGSGTSVRAPLSGTVVISRCTDGWGGLLVIRSQHPQKPWLSIRQVFAHLRVRDYSNGVAVGVGDYVAAGTEIGKSGGNPASDKCAGNSTGSHLHYQIDKDDANPEPFYPAVSSLNYRDDNFAVSDQTYNPIVLLQKGYKWGFNQTGNRELWDLHNWESWGVTDGALWLDGGNDPYVRRGGLTECGLSRSCSSSIAAESELYDSVYLDLYNACPSSSGKIYFTTSTEPNWSESKTINYYPRSRGSYRGLIYAGWHSKWRGVITGLRIDPAENCLPGVFDPTYFGEIRIED